jgi:hypothetical protein
MTISFPNDCRSYDATRGAVRFWGYDRAMESSFFIDTKVLQRLQPDLSEDEEGYLRAFDAHRDHIRAAAARVFARGPKGSYDIGLSDC